MLVLILLIVRKWRRPGGGAPPADRLDRSGERSQQCASTSYITTEFIGYNWIRGISRVGMYRVFL